MDKSEKILEKSEQGQKRVEPVYGYPLKSENRLDLIRKAVSVYATLEALKSGEVKIRKKLIEVLSFYVLNGYNRDTKTMILEAMSISKDNLTQINAELTKSGYLISDRANLRNKSLHPDLERLKNTLLSSDNIACKRAIIVRFDE